MSKNSSSSLPDTFHPLTGHILSSLPWHSSLPKQGQATWGNPTATLGVTNLTEIPVDHFLPKLSGMQRLRHSSQGEGLGIISFNVIRKYQWQSQELLFREAHQEIHKSNKLCCWIQEKFSVLYQKTPPVQAAPERALQLHQTTPNPMIFMIQESPRVSLPKGNPQNTSRIWGFSFVCWLLKKGTSWYIFFQWFSNFWLL